MEIQERRRWALVVAAVAGVATPAELADVLGVHLHGACRMLETLVAERRLSERDGMVTAPAPAPSRTRPTAPRWIDPQG